MLSIVLAVCLLVVCLTTSRASRSTPYSAENDTTTEGMDLNRNGHQGVLGDFYNSAEIGGY